jgi:dTDP-4-amino-4,6-dideoxygalactose transaminase
MTDLQGAIGRAQLEKLDRLIDERARWAQHYRQGLADLPWLRLPAGPTHGRHGWQAFVASVETAAPLPRDALMDRLQAEGIATRPGTHAIPSLGLYKRRFGLRREDCPRACACAETSLALPLHNCMTVADCDTVVSALRRI